MKNLFPSCWKWYQQIPLSSQPFLGSVLTEIYIVQGHIPSWRNLHPMNVNVKVHFVLLILIQDKKGHLSFRVPGRGWWGSAELTLDLLKPSSAFTQPYFIPSSPFVQGLISKIFPVDFLYAHFCLRVYFHGAQFMTISN